MRSWLIAVACVVMALAVVSSASGKDKGKRARAETFKGEITAVDAGSLSLSGEKGGEPKKFTMNAETKVRIETAEVDENAGGKKPVHKSVDGTAADLKVGESVVVTSADGEAATDVLVVFAKGKGRKNGGNAKPPADAPAPAPAPAPEPH